MRVVLCFPFEVSCELDLLLMVCKIFEPALDILTSYNFLSECDLDKAAGRPGKSTLRLFMVILMTDSCTFQSPFFISVLRHSRHISSCDGLYCGFPF